MGQTGAKNTLQRGDPYRTPFLVSLPSRRKMEQLRRRPKWFARSHLPPPKRADVLPHLHPSPSFYGGAAATAEATMLEKAVDDVMEAVVGAHFSDLRIEALRALLPLRPVIPFLRCGQRGRRRRPFCRARGGDSLRASISDAFFVELHARLHCVNAVRLQQKRGDGRRTRTEVGHGAAARRRRGDATRARWAHSVAARRRSGSGWDARTSRRDHHEHRPVVVRGRCGA
jgi:hypothetical protein